MALITTTRVTHLLPKHFGPKSKFNPKIEKKYLGGFLNGKRGKPGLVETDNNFRNLTQSAWYFLSRTEQIPNKSSFYYFIFDRESALALSFFIGVKTTDAILQYFSPKIGNLANLDATKEMQESQLRFNKLWEAIPDNNTNLATGGLAFARNKQTLTYKTTKLPVDERAEEYLRQIQALYRHSLDTHEAVIPTFIPGSSLYGEERIPFSFMTAIPWIVDLPSLRGALQKHQSRFPELAQAIP